MSSKKQQQLGILLVTVIMGMASMACSLLGDTNINNPVDFGDSGDLSCAADPNSEHCDGFGRKALW